MDQERFARYIRPVGSVVGTIVLVLAAAGTVAARNGVDRSAGDLQAVPDDGAAVAAQQQTGDPTGLSPAQASPDSVTGGTRPGWGCGDTNHEHSGPPGNPGATSPCDKAGSPAKDETQDQSEDTGSAADEQRRGPPAHSAAGGNKLAKPEKAANPDKPGKSEQAQTKARGPNKK